MAKYLNTDQQFKVYNIIINKQYFDIVILTKTLLWNIMACTKQARTHTHTLIH